MKTMRPVTDSSKKVYYYNGEQIRDDDPEREFMLPLFEEVETIKLSNTIKILIFSAMVYIVIILQ